MRNSAITTDSASRGIPRKGLLSRVHSCTFQSLATEVFVYTAIPLMCCLGTVAMLGSLVGELFPPYLPDEPRAESGRPKRILRYCWLGQKSPRPFETPIKVLATSRCRNCSSAPCPAGPVRDPAVRDPECGAQTVPQLDDLDPVKFI